MNTTPPITDSPWMWLALFSAVGLSALLATGGKFGKRQSGIERRYQARDWHVRDQRARDQRARDQRAGNAPPNVGTKLEAHEKPLTGSEPVADLEPVAKPEYSTPSQTLIGLWPLAGVLGVICGTSLLMLLITHKRRVRS